jgi:3-oxoacyl-[acyl-carrier protein] reductase
MRLDGKTAIVTGAGRDIGLACAKRIATAGAQIAINYFTAQAGAARAVAEIEENNGRAIALQGDMPGVIELRQ